jgi:hypothetical protein
MKAMRILAAFALILAVSTPGFARAGDRVIEHQESIESTRPDTDQSVVIEKHTTIEKEEGPDVELDVGSGGLVSSTIDLTGEVLALPFAGRGAFNRFSDPLAPARG